MKPEALLHSVSATESEDNNDSEDANESRRSGIVLNRPDSVGPQMRSRIATAPGGSMGRWRGCDRRRAFPSTDRAGTLVLSGGGTGLTSGRV